jgi:hypothetical protein
MTKKATKEQREKLQYELKKIKDAGCLTKYGLTGNSGFVGGFHLNANYAAGEGNVFQKAQLEMYPGEFVDHWERVKTEDANPDKIIKCYNCNKPAVTLDHSWPYLQEKTLCAECFDKNQKAVKE